MGDWATTTYWLEGRRPHHPHAPNDGAEKDWGCSRIAEVGAGSGLWQVDILRRYGEYMWSLWNDEPYEGHALGVAPVYSFLEETGSGLLYPGYNFLCPITYTGLRASFGATLEDPRLLNEVAQLFGKEETAVIAAKQAPALCLRQPVVLSSSSIEWSLYESFQDQTRACRIVEALVATFGRSAFLIGIHTARYGVIYTGLIDLRYPDEATVNLEGTYNQLHNEKVSGPAQYGFGDMPLAPLTFDWPFAE